MVAAFAEHAKQTRQDTCTNQRARFMPDWSHWTPVVAAAAAAGSILVRV